MLTDVETPRLENWLGRNETVEDVTPMRVNPSDDNGHTDKHRQNLRKKVLELYNSGI